MEKLKISEICSINPRQDDNIPENSEISFIPMAAVSANGQVDLSDTLESSKVKNYTVFRNGDVLFAKITPCMENGKGAIVHNLVNGYGAGSTEFIVLRPNADMITAKWLYLYLSQRSFRWECQQHMTGSAGQKRVPPKYLASCEIPVPPVPEQERIVSKIEEMFSKLEASVAELQTAKEKLKVYRQAVLKEAFEGKLSEQWRGSHNMSPQDDFLSICKQNQSFKDTSGDENEIALDLPATWLKVRIGDVFDVEVGATPKRSIPEYWNGDINWVSSGEVHFNTITETKERITESGLTNSSTNLHPAGTVMLAMIGEGKTRGQAAILNIVAAHNQNTAAILVSKTPCEPKYIYYFLLLNYENTRRVGSGNNQKALNKERVRALRFPFTSFEEQRVIVESIESRLSICDSIEQTIGTSLQQAEALRQSILKQAFEGRI